MNDKEFNKTEQQTEIYHYSNHGQISWYEFAKEIFTLKNIKCNASTATTAQYKTLANRPKNSLLDNDKIQKDFGVKQQFWKDSLKICLTNI